jgi:hypothetical protein
MAVRVKVEHQPLDQEGLSIMMIRCPHCGMDGRLPEELAALGRVLRCRKCSGRFTTHTQGPAGTIALSQPADVLASLDDDDDDDDDGLPPISSGRDDSNFDVSFALQGELDDSQFELPAVAENNNHPPPTALAPVLAESKPLPADPRYYDFIDSWSRKGFWLVVVAVAVAVMVIGGFLARALLIGQSIEEYTTALIVGFVAALTLLLVTFAATALNLLLVDLARNTRRLRIHADRGTRVASE